MSSKASIVYAEERDGDEVVTVGIHIFEDLNDLRPRPVYFEIWGEGGHAINRISKATWRRIESEIVLRDSRSKIDAAK